MADISGTGGGSSKAKSAHSKINRATTSMKTKMRTQKSHWEEYESSQQGKFSEIDSAISAIESLINQYKGKQPNVMTSYQKGMFNANMPEWEKQVFSNLNHHIFEDRANDKVARQMIRQANKQYQKYRKTVKKAQIEANKRDGWSSAIVDGTLLAIGVTAGVFLSGGAAVPLMLMVVGNVLPALDVAEDVNKAISGKKHGFNILKSWYKHMGLSNRKTESLYSGTELVTGILGSTSAYKTLVKEGFATGRVAKSTPLLQNIKSFNASHITVKNAGRLVHSVVHDGHAVRQVGHAAKTLVKGNWAAARTIPNVVRNNMSAALHTEVTTPKYDSGILKEIAKVYSNQAAVSWVKSNYVTPVADNITNKVYGDDQESLGYKVTDHVISKKLGKVAQKQISFSSKVIADGVFDNGKKSQELYEKEMTRRQFEPNDSILSKTNNYVVGPIADAQEIFK